MRYFFITLIFSFAALNSQAEEALTKSLNIIHNGSNTRYEELGESNKACVKSILSNFKTKGKRAFVAAIYNDLYTNALNDYENNFLAKIKVAEDSLKPVFQDDCSKLSQTFFRDPEDSPAIRKSSVNLQTAKGFQMSEIFEITFPVSWVGINLHDNPPWRHIKVYIDGNWHQDRRKEITWPLGRKCEPRDYKNRYKLFGNVEELETQNTEYAEQYEDLKSQLPSLISREVAKINSMKSKAIERLLQCKEIIRNRKASEAFGDLEYEAQLNFEEAMDTNEANSLLDSLTSQ